MPLTLGMIVGIDPHVLRRQIATIAAKTCLAHMQIDVDGYYFC